MRSDPLEKRREILKKVRILRLYVENSISADTVGSYRSLFLGTGMDFSEIRGYCFGDDIRNIAWSATAKNRRLYIKSFKEDRSLNVMIAVDCSKSMGFWSKTPRQESIAFVAATLALSAIKTGDRAGLILFSDRILQYLPAKSTMRNGIKIIDLLLNSKTEGKADFVTMQKFAQQVLKDPSAIFILSDFHLPFNKIDEIAKAFSILKVRHKVFPVSIWDAMELDLPSFGRVRIRDLESNEDRWVFITPALKEKYLKSMVEKKEYLKEAFENKGIPFLPLVEGEDYAKRLFNFFKKK